LIGIPNGKKLYIALAITEENTKKVIKSGFTEKLDAGETVLPNSIGRVSDLNANGSFKKLTHLPKETVYKEIEVTDWHGLHIG